VTETAGRDVEHLASRARAGRPLEVLPELLGIAETDDVDAGDQPWQAAVAATQILFWQDRFAEAADLMEAVVLRVAAASGNRLAGSDDGPPNALLAAELHAGVPATPRLRRMLDVLPVGGPLTRRLSWLLEQLPHTDVARLLPGPVDLETAPGVVAPPADAWLQRDLSALTESQRAVMWEALERANQRALARQLHDAGHRPPRWSSAVWLTGCLAAAGQVAAAERLLVEASGLWWPFRVWDCLPEPPVLQPALRTVLTGAVRDHYLTVPLGPEAAGEPVRAARPPAARRRRLAGWTPGRRDQYAAPITRLGGRPSWHGHARWPWWRGRPLPFLGQFAVDDALVLVWMSVDPDAESWKAEGGGNVAIVQPDGELPDWVRWRWHRIGPTVLRHGVLVPDAATTRAVEPAEPDWVQFDETPAAAARFVCQLGPPIDDRGVVDFGAGGEAYVFVSPDLRSARFLWQTA
jgi:hypothetical protein